MSIRITIRDDAYTVNDKTLSRKELESLMIQYHEYEILKLRHNLSAGEGNK